ncbi:MAG: DUF2027 domain-containing protein [Bacteroidaceae bacterium]
MKIGDKVRFLNEIGGGTVSGFQDKNTVTVEDEDGFDIPMLIRDCVVIETDDYNIAKVKTTPESKALKGSYGAGFTGGGQSSSRFRAEKPDTYVHSYDDDEDDKPITFKPRPVERRDGENLNVYLAFVPVNIKELSDTAFEAYLINDSNYYLNFLYLSAEGTAWNTRFEATVEPNTKLFMEEFRRDKLNEMGHVAVQLMAYKRERSFLLKPAISVELRPDATKFYKLHLFQENDFFNEKALMYDLVRNNQPARQVFVKAEELQEALLSKKKEDERPHHAPARKEKPANEIEEIDLHAAEILDTTNGMKHGEILEYQLSVFRKAMDQHKGEKGKKLVFIHGKGEGVLRNAVIKELKANYKTCIYQDASFREYGFGATMVCIK